MGTDIHTHIEVKLVGRDEWLHYAAPAVQRNYTLFGLMSDIGRDLDVRPIVPPRGLPADLSEVTRACWEADRKDFRPHGMSWLGVEDLRVLRGRLEGTMGSAFDWLKHDLEHGIFRTYLLGSALTDIRAPFADLRIVFWFDC